jgi:hypothetical protein
MAGFCESAVGLRAPKFAAAGAKSPIVSGGYLKYSRFRETATGDRVRSGLRGRSRSAIRLIARVSRHRCTGAGGHRPECKRDRPMASCMYPSWISRSLCSAGIARCIKPLAQSRNETNSSWVNGGAGAIPRLCAGFPSGRLTSSNVATWVLSTQDSNTTPQTSQDTWPVCGIKNFASVRSYSAPQLHLTIVAILGICARNRPFSSVEV